LTWQGVPAADAWSPSPPRQQLGTIPLSRAPQNLAFAGPDKKTLYIVGRNAAWNVQMLSSGYKGRAK
jgi:gluconolactonase